MSSENSKSLLEVAQDVRKEHQDELNKLESSATAAEAENMPSEEIKEPSITPEISNEQVNT
jgi:hypothetical protein